MMMPRTLFEAFSQSGSPLVVNAYTTARKYGLARKVTDTTVTLQVNDGDYRVAVYGIY